MQKTSVGRVQENDKGFPCAGLSFGRKACHVPLSYLSFIFPVNSVSDISGLAVHRLDLLVYPPTMPSAAGSVWLSKCLSHLTVMEQRTGFCSDGTKCDCLDFDEDAINLVFIWVQQQKEPVQNGRDSDAESSSPISVTCALGRRAVQRATESLSVE